MKKIKINLVLLILLFTVSENVFAQQPQQIYRTNKADIALTILYKDTVIIAVSNEVIVVLDYETGKLIFRVMYETFHTGIDSIDKKFKQLNSPELKFEGKLDISINTKKETAQKYNITGNITNTTPPFSLEGNGTVVCVPAIGNDAVPSCKLYANMHCKLSELNLTGVFQNAANNTQIDLRQTLLEREKAN